MDLHFAQPNLLLLIWLVPAVALWWHTADKRREQALRGFMDDELQRKLRPARSRRFGAQWALTLAGLTCCLVAAARPQWGQREEIIFSRGRDIVIALDVSRSMLANDVRPSRLQRSKIDLMDLVHELRGDRAALLAFRRSATLLCPLTSDYAYFMQALEGAGVESAPAGETDIGAAIRSALEAFETSGGSHKAIVLISDGEDLAGGAKAAAEEAAKRGIVIFTVGVGSRAGSTIPDPDAQSGHAVYRGDVVTTKLENESLHTIATVTHGAYIPMETASTATTTLGTLYRDYLSKIASQELEETLQRRYIERFQWFLLPGVLCLLAATFFSPGRLASRRNTGRQTSKPKSPLKNLTPPPLPVRTLMFLLIAGGLLAGGAEGQTNTPLPAATNDAPKLDIPEGRAGARLAQRLFTEKKYAAAAEAYLVAAQTASAAAQHDYRFNAAIALDRAGKHTEAANLFRDLAADAHDVDAAMGLGTSLHTAAETLPGEDAAAMRQRADLTRDSAEAFRVAARADPKAEAARHNAAVAVADHEARESAAHIAEVLAKYQSTDAGNLAYEMLRKQRNLNARIQSVATNIAPSRITEFEKLSVEQKENADLWIPLKGKLLAAQPSTQSTNIPAAAVEQTIELTRDAMLSAAEKLRNLDPDTKQEAQISERAVYEFWKAVAPGESLIREDILLQTNAIAASQSDTARPNKQFIDATQHEARELTERFIKRFAEQYPEQSATEPTITMPNAPPTGESMSSTNRAKILELAGQAGAAQDSALNFLGTDDLPSSLQQQQVAHKILKEIEALLPKSDKSQQQQQSEQQQNKDGQADKSGEDSQKQPEEQPKEQPEESPKPEPPAEQKQAPAEEEKKDEKLPEDVQRLLDKALQREREHDAEKRREQRVPLSPMERDW